MDNKKYECIFEEITNKAVADTVEKLLKYPFGFHGDTGIRDYLYSRLHFYGGDELDVDDARSGYSTLLLQSEHYTTTKYGPSEGRFDLALTLPPESSETIEDRFAENLRACFAFELGKNKDLDKVVDPVMAGQSARNMTGTTDLSKLYHELAHHGLKQGWAIEFFDSRVTNGVPTISKTLDVCNDLHFKDNKKLIVIFVGFSPDGEHYVSSNDSDVQASLIKVLGKRGINATSDLVAYSIKPAPPYQQGGWGTSDPSASLSDIFQERTSFARRIIEIGGIEESGRSSQYVNLSTGSKKNIAQLHLQEDGIALVLKSRTKNPPETDFMEIPVSSLSGYKGTNKSWLDGSTVIFEKKGPAIAFLIPFEIEELGNSDRAWQEVANLLNHAKVSL
jgi:hypothetical protein